MIKLELNPVKYENDLLELVRMFEQFTDMNVDISMSFEYYNGVLEVKIKASTFENFIKIYRYQFDYNSELEFKRLEKRYLKMALYKVISFITGVNLPYGCLTGIRPTKLYREFGENADEVFTYDFNVSYEKLKVIKDTVNTQNAIKNRNNDKIDFYVHIPFCPSRCAYCSFISTPINKQKAILEEYTEKLIKEIRLMKRYIRENKIKLRSIYIGGGTPTSLPIDLLEKILKTLNMRVKEFTVEAGRPDTITPEMVDLLLKYKVTRLSINPQTFLNRTLKVIGRKHTNQDTLNAYNLVKDKFDINMDLIAALPGESLKDFENNIKKAVKLNPASITVHTLYLKAGSELKVEGYNNNERNAEVFNMINFSFKYLEENGYNPYYMYRQKYTAGSLENVSYAKPGKECVYNVDIMEDDTSIIACGAGSSSKLIKEKDLIVRQFDFKEPREYILRFDEIIQKKKEFFEINF